MFNSVNKLTNVNQIASSLNTDAVRHLLPSEARDIQRLMSSDTTGLGSLGSSADRIRSNYRVDLPALRPDATAFERSNRDSISRNGDMAARDAAIAEAAYGVTAQRTTGLEELRSSLDTASDAKDVMDIKPVLAWKMHISRTMRSSFRRFRCGRPPRRDCVRSEMTRPASPSFSRA
jgi:type IV secretion system protein VirB5